MRLVGRRRECETLDRLVADVGAGASRVAVLRGEAGVGKSALLTYLCERAAGWRIVSLVGVESEMELRVQPDGQTTARVVTTSALAVWLTERSRRNG